MPLLLLVLSACLTYEPPDSPPTEVPRSVPTPPDDTVTESWVQRAAPSVDLLFVVDNSSSMGAEQALLVEGMVGFFAALHEADVDFQVGVVATDIQRPAYSGNLQAIDSTRFITAQDAEPAGLFTGIVEQMGLINSSVEAGRAAAWLALETLRDSEANEGFQREEAALHIVFVSDTVDNSGAHPISNPDFRDWAVGLKAPPARVVMHAIVQQVDDVCSGMLRPGVDYLGYAEVFDGVTGSVCAPSLEPVLLEIADSTTDLNSRFPLVGWPDPATIRVSVDDPGAPDLLSMCFEARQEGCDVLYLEDRRLLVFLDYVPPVDAEITVAYTPQGA